MSKILTGIKPVSMTTTNANLSNYAYPASQGATGQTLLSNGSGSISWQNCGEYLIEKITTTTTLPVNFSSAIMVMTGAGGGSATQYPAGAGGSGGWFANVPLVPGSTITVNSLPGGNGADGNDTQPNASAGSATSVTISTAFGGGNTTLVAGGGGGGLALPSGTGGAGGSYSISGGDTTFSAFGVTGNVGAVESLDGGGATNSLPYGLSGGNGNNVADAPSVVGGGNVWVIYKY